MVMSLELLEETSSSRGYIGVGEEESVQLFYYFIESEGNPHEDPLIIWLAGGPGCSGLLAFFYEIGPFKFMDGKYIDNVPALRLDPNRWTKVANIIYVDAPTLTGFSYTTTPEAVVTSDTLSASNNAEFIRKFVRDHPRFLKNPLYVAGISYSGIVIPLVTEEIYKGNDAGLKPMLNIKGYIEGNPLTDKTVDINARLKFVHRVALISDELYMSTRKNCNGKYANADYDNSMCLESIAEVNNRIKRIYIEQILDPSWYSDTNLIRSRNSNYLPSNPIKMVTGKASLRNIPSQDFYGYEYEVIWANDMNVRRALNIREGTVKEWVACNRNMAYYGQSSTDYNFNIHSNVVYHKNVSTRNCRALVFREQVMKLHNGNPMSALRWLRGGWHIWLSNCTIIIQEYCVLLCCCKRTMNM